jgi:hypothetical protein
MRVVGNHQGARTISLALAAGLVAFEAVLALGAGAIGVPGLLLVRFTAESAKVATAQAGGGETVIAKLAESDSKPTGALGPSKAEDEPTLSAPQLKSLGEIPVEAQQDDKPKEEKPPAPKPFDADSKAREVLPWDEVEPVPFTALDSAAPATPEASVAANAAPRPSPMPLPPSGEVEGWVKAQASEIKGEDRDRPLYHFELWLDAPAEVRKRLVAVAYDFNTPAVQPQSQVSSEEETGFRVRVGGLACADKITVTLTFKDGRSQQVAVDGCRLLG